MGAVLAETEGCFWMVANTAPLQDWPAEERLGVREAVARVFKRGPLSQDDAVPLRKGLVSAASRALCSRGQHSVRSGGQTHHPAEGQGRAQHLRHAAGSMTTARAAATVARLPAAV